MWRSRANGLYSVSCSPLESKDGQTFRTGLRGKGSPTYKAADSDAVVNELLERARKTGLFDDDAGDSGDLKCQINRAFTEEELDALVDWCRITAKKIRQLRLKTPATDSA